MKWWLDIISMRQCDGSLNHPVPSTVFCVTTFHQPLTTLLFNGDTFCVYWIKLVTNYFLSRWTFYFMFWKMSVWGPLLGYPLTKTKWCQFMQVILYKTNIEIIASQNCHRHNFPLTGQIKQFKSKKKYLAESKRGEIPIFLQKCCSQVTSS